MQLREHLDKGVWTVADKSLLLLYGFAVILVVVGVLPENEWGVFNLFQPIFIIICFIADSIFLQPMVKFASEHKAEVPEILGASFILYVGSMTLGALLCWGMTNFLADFLNSDQLRQLLPLMPLLLAANIFRNVGIRYLQITYRIRAIFWVDFAFFGSIVALTIAATALGKFHSAYDFLLINLAGGVFSSITAIIFARNGFRTMPLFNVPREEYGKLLSFAKYQAGTSIMQTLQQWADYLVVGIYHSPREVGLYAAAKTLYRLFDAVREGATLLIVPITSRLFSEGDKEKLSNLVEKLLFLAFGVLVPIALVLSVGSDQLMDLFYKDKFPGISEVFRILILTGTILPLMLVSTNVLIGMGHAKGLFFSFLGGTIIFFVLNRVLIPDLASTGAALSVLISTAAIGIFSFISMRRQLDVSFRGVAGNVRRVRSTLASIRRRDTGA